ncbi:MAG: molecular chaperone HtpG [Bacteroidales bacterium]|nr:molecular chaperone HtpG [Bacteroidales bacterium]
MLGSGKIGVTTDNIFPVIKKFLYSDQEIFLREIVSNAVDATQKMKTIVASGQSSADTDDLRVSISIDKEAKTLTISDQGIGMTAEEIDKYINQIAFSGAGEFLEKYQNDAHAIIGHFGLGFYSAFMVAKQVDIITLSYQEGAEAVKWSCQGSPEFTIEACDKKQRGTDIVLHIDEESEEYLQEDRIASLLQKYCKFLPVPIVFGKKKEWKDGKEVTTEEDNQINDIQPAWTRKPSDLQEEDYNKFYKDLYPFSDDPLFHIHLNVDYPFTLTGILYFPKVKSSIDLQKNKIQLYCNQVFVTDSIEGIVPPFLTLLHGVIDSPDIPLNVSRSYLQSDANVKKISNHITKKVADSLQKLYNDDRKAFEEKWDDLKIFIEYGVLTEEKFWDRAEKFILIKNSEGNFFNLEEYHNLVSGNQTDKDGNLVYLYATDKDSQYTYIETARNKGYDVLLMDGELDVPFIQQVEAKSEKTRFVRVDSDIIENLIPKEDKASVSLSEDEQKQLKGVFEKLLPLMDKTRFDIQLEALGQDSLPIVLTQNEFMRRMQDMSKLQPGMSFYGEMPAAYSFVLNADHRLIKDLVGKEDEAAEAKVKQLIDLSLLSNGLLKGEALNNFIRRSYDLF